MKINDILLASSVKRWTIVSTIKQQSLAEHSFNVAMIARDIATHFGVSDTMVTKLALDHDLDEIMTGDIPSPAKRRAGLPDIYDGKSRRKCTSYELTIVRAADLIDALLFINNNAHDRHGIVVKHRYAKRVERFISEIVSNKLRKAVDDTLTELEFGKYDVEEWL